MIDGTSKFGRSQLPRGLRRRSTAARLLRLWVRIPPGIWMFVVSVVFCQVEVELITRPGESYRLWCVTVCDLETSWMRRHWPTGGGCDKNKKKLKFRHIIKCFVSGRKKNGNPVYRMYQSRIQKLWTFQLSTKCKYRCSNLLLTICWL